MPYNATNFSVTATTKNNIITPVDYLIYPYQVPRMMNDTTPFVLTLPDSATYFSGSDYPARRAWIVEEGFLAGENHIVTVAVAPIAYKHASSGVYENFIIMSKSITLTLSFELSTTTSLQPIVRDDGALRSEGFQLTQNMVANPNNVIGNAPSASFLNGSQNECDYLVVTTQELLHSMRRLVALNRQKGYNVKTVTMGDILSDSLANCGDILDSIVLYNDNAGCLRQYLRNYYKYNGLKYVLLAGDIPYRIYTRYGRDLLTDWYFCDLNSKWTDFAHDKEPELYVGRIIAKDNEQVDNYTNKLLMYELNPGNGDYSYLRRAFFSNGRDFPDFLNRTRSILNPIFLDCIVINDTIGNNSRYPRGHHIIDTIRSRRVGFMSIFNHGDRTRTKTYGPDTIPVEYFIKTFSTESSGNGVNRLLNKYHPIIFYSPSCGTIPFDENETNLGEAFTTGKDYGGPVYIGHTRKVYAIESRYMAEKFASQVWENKKQLGAAYAISTGLSAPYCKEDIYTHGFIGDPVIELWTSEPQAYSGINISRNDNSITINGIQTDSTIVAYCQNDFSSGYQTVSDSTVTLTNVSPNCIITLYGHNYLPYFMPIELQNITLNNSQYVFAGDFTAGCNVNSNRAIGEVVVKSGIEYEIETSGIVTLDDGFKVELGATFKVLPSCVR